MIDVYTVKKKIENVKASKNNPIYNSSMYWSQKSYNLADILIEEFTKPGDIIFDPFMGSGVTIIEAVSDKYNRNAIGSEINDVPIFLTKFTLDKIPDNALERLKEFSCELHETRQELYGELCHECHSNGEISSIVFDKNNEIKIKNVNFICSNKKCKCKSFLNTNQIYNKMNYKYNIEVIKDEELIYNSKIAVSNGMRISDIFTPRNFKALDSIIKLKNTKYNDISKVIDYILLSMLHLCKITDTHSNSQWPLWTPKMNCVEKNVFMILDRKIKKLEDYILQKKLNYTHSSETAFFLPGDKNKYKIVNCGAQNITEREIADASVDLIITDPPYMGQVLYSEYMQLYKPFLGFNYNLKDEIVVSSAPSRMKKENEYFDMLERAINVCGKKIKDKHYMAMYFHDSNLNVWNKLITITKSAGFEYISQIHVDKTITLKNILSPKKSLNGDSILFFIKIDNLNSTPTSNVWREEIEIGIVDEAKKMLSLGPLSTPELYDNGLMEIIIQNGWLEPLSRKYKSLVEIFEKYFIWEGITARWKLVK